MDGFERRVYVEAQLADVAGGFLDAGADEGTEIWNQFRSTIDRSWWRVDSSTGTWERFESGTWRPASESPRSLEGISPLPFAVTPAPPLKNPEITVSTTTERVSTAVLRVQANYLAGRFGHVLATERLQSFLLATAEGLWTTGFWSSSWYRHDGARWARQPVGPPESELVEREQLPQHGPDSPLTRSIVGLYESWEAIPEAVSPDFDPPGFEGDS